MENESTNVPINENSNSKTEVHDEQDLEDKFGIPMASTKELYSISEETS